MVCCGLVLLVRAISASISEVLAKVLLLMASPRGYSGLHTDCLCHIPASEPAKASRSYCIAPARYFLLLAKVQGVCLLFTAMIQRARKSLLADTLPIPPFLEEGFLSFLFWVLDCVSEFGPLFWPLYAHRYVLSKTHSKTKQEDEFVCKAYDLQNRETQGCGSNKFPASY